MSWHELTKLGAGGCLAILFTATVFGPMGFGRRYLDNLQHRVRADLDARELSQVDVAIEQQPTSRRVIVLSGEVSARDRMIALEISQRVAGVAGVHWSAGNREVSAKLPSVWAEDR